MTEVGSAEEKEGQDVFTEPTSNATTKPLSRESEPERSHSFEADLYRKQSNIEKRSPSNSTDRRTSIPSAVRPIRPKVVDWDSPNDPAKALNWPAKKKWGNIAVISSIIFLTPLASFMFAPGIPQLMRDFQSTDQTLAVLVVSVYVLGFAIGPVIIAPLSELYGRLYIYHVCNVRFVIFTVTCAVALNMGSLIVFRLLEGCAGSAPLTIGGGSLADMVVQEEQGAAMAIFVSMPFDFIGHFSYFFEYPINAYFPRHWVPC